MPESFWICWKRGALLYLIAIAGFIAVLIPFALIEVIVGHLALSPQDQQALTERIATPFAFVAFLIFGPYIMARLVRRFVRSVAP